MMKPVDTGDIVIDENGSMLSTSLKSRWQQLIAIAFTCSAVTVSATAGIRPAQAESPSTSSTGISLYGEVPQPGQVGTGYILLEKQGDTLIGAFYYPRSEYSCFTGKQDGQSLDILALPNHQDPIASFSLSLDEMQPILEIGASERQTLAACRQDVIAFLQEKTLTEVANQTAR